MFDPIDSDTDDLRHYKSRFSCYHCPLQPGFIEYAMGHSNSADDTTISLSLGFSMQTI